MTAKYVEMILFRIQYFKSLLVYRKELERGENFISNVFTSLYPLAYVAANTKDQTSF